MDFNSILREWKSLVQVKVHWRKKKEKKFLEKTFRKKKKKRKKAIFYELDDVCTMYLKNKA